MVILRLPYHDETRFLRDGIKQKPEGRGRLLDPTHSVFSDRDDGTS